MKINWTVRFKNRLFWVAIIPAVIMLIKTVLSLFGVEFDFTSIEAGLVAIVEAVFVILGILGIVVDPTTKGVNDSAQANTYTEPKAE